MQREYRPRFAIALISAAVLAYEVLLMALFSLVQWHHFAYLVDSIALLGFAVSASLLVFGARRLEAHYRGFASSQAILFAVTAVICFAVAQRLSFNPEELIWDPGHWLRLGLVILLLMLPFLFAANLIGLALIEYRQRLARVYAAIYYHRVLIRYNPNRGTPIFGARRRIAMGISLDPPRGYHPIAILVNKGNVTLAGVVDNDMDKQLAGVQANSVSGVFSVTNELESLNPSKRK